MERMLLWFVEQREELLFKQQELENVEIIGVSAVSEENLINKDCRIKND